MKLLYLYINLGSFLIPFIFSFHPKLKFYKKWKSLFPAILIMMAFFISWDVIFTNAGIWGFNEFYISGYKILSLPIEEWLFFICIPYACLFTHYSLLYFFPNFKISIKVTSVVHIILLSILSVTLLYYYNRWYTLINFLYGIVLLGLIYNYWPELLRTFYPTFIVILLPFIIVNGILTGSWIKNQVVWYNDAENLGVRLLTIPIEDIIYALTMLLTVFVLTEYFEKQYAKK
jgi:lycopene cyclase domain-containing protein